MCGFLQPNDKINSLFLTIFLGLQTPRTANEVRPARRILVDTVFSELLLFVDVSIVSTASKALISGCKVNYFY